jgi:hypothetical protein
MTVDWDPFDQDVLSQLGRFTHIPVPTELVCEGDVREQAWCLVQADDGWWDVFYHEHGGRGEDLGRADSRLAAIRLLAGRLLYSDILNREA